MDKWKCIKSFSVAEFDGDENIIEDVGQQIEVGSIWENEEAAQNNDIRLGNDSMWLEVSEETFENCFEELEGSF